MLHYILQIIAFQVVFLLVYDLFLKRETFFNYNRFYLLSTAIASFFLPFIKLESIQTITPKDFIIVLPEVIIGAQNAPTELDAKVALLGGLVLEEPSKPLWQILILVGMVAAALFFIYKIIKLYWLQYKNPKRWHGNVLLVNLLKSNSAFSFFNTIFLGEKLSEVQKPSILEHELVHVKQWHSLDLIGFEIMRIVMWFNPLIYMYQNRIKALHEFIADEAAIKQTDKKMYYQDLLNQVFETHNLSFINTFFKTSLIKKRIVMLQKSKSKQIALFKYVLLIPVVFGMLLYVSCEKSLQLDANSPENLVRFEYSLKLGESMSPEIEEIHKRYEEFLKSNQDYVSWGTVNLEEKRVNYSVHHISENVPEGYEETEVSFPDGRSYKMLMNFSYFSKEVINAMEEINTKDFDNESEVPFSVIENVPTSADCMGLTDNEERKKCTSQKVAKFVNKNFNTGLAMQLGLEGRQRISVFFKIDEEGNVGSIGARAPHPGLEEEAKRVMAKLPQFIPGTHKGKPVTVPYSLPIIFQVHGNSSSANQNTYEAEERNILNYDDVVGDGIAFSRIDKIPSYKECQSISSNDQKRKCVKNSITSFVNRNFNTDLAEQLGLSGRQRIAVLFKIGKDGSVHSISARAVHPKLEEEAKRIINMLPKFTPGEQGGEKVDVLYSLPISFQIQ